MLCNVRVTPSVIVRLTSDPMALRYLCRLLGRKKYWPDLYWTRDGSSVEKDHPPASSINTGRAMRRTIGVPCDSSRFYTVL